MVVEARVVEESPIKTFSGMILCARSRERREKPPAPRKKSHPSLAFDYQGWRKERFGEMTVEEILSEASQQEGGFQVSASLTIRSANPKELLHDGDRKARRTTGLRTHFSGAALREYLVKNSGSGWWLAVSTISGFWGVFSWLLPEVAWLQRVPGWVLLATPTVALFVGLYFAYQKKWQEAQSLKADQQPFAAVAARVQAVLEDELTTARQAFRERLGDILAKLSLTNNRFSSAAVLRVRKAGIAELRLRAELISHCWAEGAAECHQHEKALEVVVLATERLQQERQDIEVEVEGTNRPVKGMKEDSLFLEGQCQLSKGRLIEEINCAWGIYSS